MEFPNVLIIWLLFHVYVLVTFKKVDAQEVNSPLKKQESVIDPKDFNTSYKNVEYLSVQEVCSPNTFKVEDNKLYVLTSSTDAVPYTCQQRFEAKNSSSSVNLKCIKMHFGAACQYEAMTITVDDQNTKLCKGKETPTKWEGRFITMHYFRRILGMYGGYACGLTTVPSPDVRNSSKWVTNESLEYLSNEAPSNIASRSAVLYPSSTSIRSVITPKEPIVKKRSMAKPCTKCGFASEHKRPRVNGGKNGTDTHPWFAVLIVENSKNISSLCSATLISASHLLTTAQCLNKDVIEIEVGLGKFNLSDEGEKGSLWMKTRNFSFHVDFDPSDSIEGGLFHVAVVTLPSPVNFTEFIRPICLPDSYIGNMAGDQATGVGWGLTAVEHYPGFVLQEINLRIVNNEKCLTGIPIENFHICAKPLQRGGIGYHDLPGRPLMIQVSGQWTLVGLYVHGFTLPFNQVSDLYIRLASIKTWLDTFDLDGICY